MAVEKKFRILIYPGLHTRPGAKFVELCNKFESCLLYTSDAADEP